MPDGPCPLRPRRDARGAHSAVRGTPSPAARSQSRQRKNTRGRSLARSVDGEAWRPTYKHSVQTGGRGGGAKTLTAHSGEGAAGHHDARAARRVVTMSPFGRKAGHLDLVVVASAHRQPSSASNARPLEASPRPPEARLPAQTNNRPSCQRAAW